ncbi:chaoptin-like [Penaeus indicus]|uniref:chaoptin-like n=1 Tax=Penaeus indicus TaxID=29960 RepID=UPI00300C8B9D
MPRSITWAFVLVLVSGISWSASADEEGKLKCPKNSPYFYPCTCEGGGDKGIFIRCENSNLASISVGLGNSRLPIEELHIYKCNIKKLQGPLFRSLVLHRLVIEDTPISEIDGEVFKNVAASLTELIILRAPLEGVPTAALAPLKNLENLKIDGAAIPRLGPDALPNLPNLEKLEISRAGLTNINANALTRLSKLKRVAFPHNELSSIARNTFKNKRSIKLLDLAFNNFTKLDSQYFQDLNQMTWCNMSNNAIKNFGRNPFARNTLLGWLNLSNNKLGKIESNSFRSMRFLRRLFLSDNEIKTVGRGAFNGMRRIGTIDLARNKLRKVDFKMFDDLQFVENIDLAENQIQKVEKNSFKDLFLVAINMSHNEITTFDDGAFVNTLNVTVLDLSYNSITAIPKEVFPGEQSYMTELRLQYNNLTNLGNLTMHFPGIKILNVSYNQIENIPRRMFPKLYELHTIDASHNRINSIERGVFTTLFSIRNINLSYNDIGRLFGSIFGNIPTLLRLDMSHNKIPSVARGMFASLVSLRELYLNNNQLETLFLLPQSLNYLYLQHNNISEIPANTWPQMNALLYMNLDHNNLRDTMDGGTFRNLNSLRELRLVNNSITVPSWQAFSEMQTLQHLYLDHNNITNITRGAFGRLPVVFTLSLTHNGVSNISKQAFDGLLQLITLNLSHNALHHIPNEAFRGCVSMRVIDLSHNFLNKVDNGTNGLFDDLLSIRHINVSHNTFGTISKKMFPYHQWIPYNLQTVDLSYNHMPVLHKNLLIGMQKVKKLNVSHNFLNEIRPGVLGNLTKLEVIDLSFNDLEALGNGVFGRGRALREVYLQNNTLISVPAAVFMANENITMLDLTNNNLHHYYPEFVSRAINGTTIKYNGNPVECDCTLRKIRSWLDNRLDSSSWNDVVCATPQHLQGRALPFISEEELRCSDNRRSFEQYQVNPDVRFRLKDVENKDVLEKLDISWYVTTREDVGGFKVSVYNTTSGKEVSSKTLGYTTRSQRFPEVPRGRYRVCVGGLTSTEESRALQPAQCHGFFVSHAHLPLPMPSLLIFLTILMLFR